MRYIQHNNLILYYNTMINNFCVCTLTHSTKGRGEALRYTIKTFMDDYIHTPFEWFIWVNITDDDINETLEWAKKEYEGRVHFNIHISDKNLGPGGGINRLNELSKAYEYSFFIEGDWITVPHRVSGFSHHWIQNSINFLERNPDIDHVQLRRYLDDLDDRQYAIAPWIRPENVERIEEGENRFVVMKERMYTNTPCLRKMSAYYAKGVFPLNEYYDADGNPTEHKGNPAWGQAELSAHDMKAAWLEFGNFLHFEDWQYKDNWDQYLEDKFGCGVYDNIGPNRCKYGYMVPGHFFCAVCEKDEDLTQLVIHNERYLRNVLPAEHGHVDLSDEQILQEIEKLVKNPTINAREYVDFDTYKNENYIRYKKHN